MNAANRVCLVLMAVLGGLLCLPLVYLSALAIGAATGLLTVSC